MDLMTEAEGSADLAFPEPRPELHRAPELDFEATYAVVGKWRGLVWIAEPRTE